MTLPRLSVEVPDLAAVAVPVRSRLRRVAVPVRVVPAAMVAAVEPMAPSPAAASQRAAVGFLDRRFQSGQQRFAVGGPIIGSGMQSGGQHRGHRCLDPAELRCGTGLFTGQRQAARLSEQSRAGEQFGQHHTAAVHIGTLIDGLTRSSLRRHIARGATQAQVTRG